MMTTTPNDDDLTPVEPDDDDTTSPYDHEQFVVEDGVGVHDPDATELDPNTDPDREW